jgi:hypothetical protein
MAHIMQTFREDSPYEWFRGSEDRVQSPTREQITSRLEHRDPKNVIKAVITGGTRHGVRGSGRLARLSELANKNNNDCVD